MEEQLAGWDSEETKPMRARTMGGSDDEDQQYLKARVQELENIVRELRMDPRHRTVQNTRKPISELKVIQNVMPLTEDKLKFREWNNTFVNAMGQVDPMYGKAIKRIMHWADAEVSPDLKHGWPQKGGVVGIGEMDNLNIEMLDQDLSNVLLEKAVGTVHTKVMNGEPKGGIHIYTEVYKWFTETSGLGLAEQARTLMHPDPVKKEEEIVDRVEDWIQKVERLSRHGSDYEMAAAYKSAALQNLLIGESRKLYLQWKAEGVSLDNMLAKVKDYARGLKLDGDANKGKQTVDLNRVQNWAEEVGAAEEQGEVVEDGINSVIKSATSVARRDTLSPSAAN